MLLMPSLSIAGDGNPIQTKSADHSSRTIEALVSTQWLDDNLKAEDLVILDVREPELYEAGHIRGSINVIAPGNFFECFLDPDAPVVKLRYE